MIPNFLIDYSNNWMIFIKALKNKIQMKKILIVFDDMIADMLCNEKLNPVVTKLFIRGRK